MSEYQRRRSRIRDSFSKIRPRWSRSGSIAEPIFLAGIDPEPNVPLQTARSRSSTLTSTSSREADLFDVAEFEIALTPLSTMESLVEEAALLDIDKEQPEVQAVPLDQPFPFLDLPLEIQQIVYKHYFPPQHMTIQIKKRNSTAEVVVQNPWNPSLALLQVCKSIYKTARPFLDVREYTLDLSHYTPDSFRVPTIQLMDMVHNPAVPCTSLVLDSLRVYDGPSSATPMSSLRSIELLDHLSWRECVYKADSTKLTTNFDQESRRVLANCASSVLQSQRAFTDAGITAEATFVCDVLICVDDDDAVRLKQDKLRHMVKFGYVATDGRLVATEWVTRQSELGPQPLRHQIAPHIHEYCLHYGKYGRAGLTAP